MQSTVNFFEYKYIRDIVLSAVIALFLFTRANAHACDVRAIPSESRSVHIPLHELPDSFLVVSHAFDPRFGVSEGVLELYMSVYRNGRPLAARSEVRGLTEEVQESSSTLLMCGVSNMVFRMPIDLFTKRFVFPIADAASDDPMVSIRIRSDARYEASGDFFDETVVFTLSSFINRLGQLAKRELYSLQSVSDNTSTLMAIVQLSDNVEDKFVVFNGNVFDVSPRWYILDHRSQGVLTFSRFTDDDDIVQWEFSSELREGAAVRVLLSKVLNFSERSELGWFWAEAR